ncbi:MAG: methyltransferase domain-containing protein [Acidimicrobiales bacterium]
MTIHDYSEIDVLDLHTWARPADHIDRSVLWGIPGPVLEVGCGPGRLVAALAEAGIPALGIDIAPLAIELAERRGAPMMERSIFDRVPGEGRWPTVLLLDGSIGIGGNPTMLLRRVRQVLAPRGLALVEVLGPGGSQTNGNARIESEVGTFETIPWATLGIDHLEVVAAHAGFALETARQVGRRWFSWLRSESTI